MGLHNFHLNIPIFNKLQTTRFLILSNKYSQSANMFRLHVFGGSQLGITVDNNTDIFTAFPYFTKESQPKMRNSSRLGQALMFPVDSSSCPAVFISRSSSISGSIHLLQHFISIINARQHTRTLCSIFL